MKSNLKTSATLRIFAAIASSFLIASTLAQIPSEQCEDFEGFAANTNAKAPIDIDSETELIQIKVNCVGGLIAYTKRLVNFHSDVMLEGWKERKQVQHTQLHCNREGLATRGISTVDVLHNPDYSFAAKFMTRPEDCAQ